MLPWAEGRFNVREFMSRKGTKPQDQGNNSNPQNMASGAPRMPDRTTGGNGGNGHNRDQGNLSFSSEEIAERAYQIFEREGRTEGRDMEHWLQAERELRAEREQPSGNRVANAASRGAAAPRADEAPRSARRLQEQQQSPAV